MSVNITKESLFQALKSVNSKAKELGATLSPPSVAVLGNVQTGKTEVLQTLVNVQISKYGAPTNRVVDVTFRNGTGETCVAKTKQEPEKHFANYEACLDEVLNRNDFGVSGNSDLNNVPIVVTAESSTTTGIQFIDTPPIDIMSHSLLDSVITLPSRLLVVVLSPVESENVIKSQQDSIWECKEILKKIAHAEKSASRTIFVINKIDLALTSHDENEKLRVVLNSYRSLLKGRNVFFVGTNDSITKSINSTLEFGFGTAIQDRFIGYDNLKNFFNHWMWNSYQDRIVDFVNTIKEKAKKANLKTTELTRKQKCIGNPSLLRAAAADYIGQFIKVIEHLVSGTLTSSQAGMTAAHEDEVLGPWKYPFEAVESSDAFLHGIDQLNRTLSQFKVILRTTKEEFTPDEISLVENKFSEAAKSAEKLIRVKTVAIAENTVNQLIERSIFIMKRLPQHSSARVLASRGVPTHLRTQSALAEHIALSSDAILVEPTEAKLFVAHIDGVFSQFVDELGDRFREKSFDDIACIGITDWENWDLSFAQSNTSVEKYVTTCCEIIRERFAQNILLKCHHYLINPMLTELPAYLNGAFSALSDDEIRRLFSVEFALKDLESEATSCNMISEFLTGALSSLENSLNVLAAPWDRSTHSNSIAV